MRLWTVHPRYLDAKGLVAAWREALLAQKILAGGTKGYRHHPQLTRFRSQREPVQAIASFLLGLADEATKRGYRFDVTKISTPKLRGRLPETDGQLLYEWDHLQNKLRVRAPALWRQFGGVIQPDSHPLFRIVPGQIRDWEKRIG
jgi:Pyrimidine dimer DNA glycosylase